MMEIQKALIQQALIAHEAQIEDEYKNYEYSFRSIDVKFNLGRHPGYVVQCESVLDIYENDMHVAIDPYTTTVWFNDDLTIDEII